jgi:hypothetical protein
MNLLWLSPTTEGPGVALAFQATLNALLGLSACFLRVVDQPLLFGDPLLKLLDFLLNTRLLLRLRRLEPALEIFELVLQHLDGTFWSVHPG